MACTDLSASDYTNVRIALGLAGDDTTVLPNAVIASPVYAGWASVRMASAAALCETLSCDAEDDLYSAAWALAVNTALVAFTASLIAKGYFGARGDSRVTSEALGSLRVSYDKTDWTRVGGLLADMAQSALSLHCPAAASRLVGGGGAGEQTLISVDGPGRYRHEETIEDRLADLDPWITQGLG